jgi:hypothetical protein
VPHWVVQAGRWDLDLKAKIEPPGLVFGCATASASGGMIEGSAGDNKIAGGWDACSAKHAGVAVLGQKTETEPLGLDFGCATANGSGA